MSRTPIWIYTGAKNPSQSVVTSQTNTAATTLPEIVIGTNEVFAIQFTDGSNVAPSFCNANTHSLSVAISTAEASDVAPLIYTDNFTQTTYGWQGEIPLTSASLYAHVNADDAVSDTVPKSRLWFQATVIRTSDGQRVAHALAPIYVWARAMPDTFPLNTQTPAKTFQQWANEIANDLVLSGAYSNSAAASALSASVSNTNAAASALDAQSSGEAAAIFAQSASNSANAAANVAANVNVVFVPMPLATNSAGSVGQIAIDGDKFAVYRNGTGWIFFVGYQV